MGIPDHDAVTPSLGNLLLPREMESIYAQEIWSRQWLLLKAIALISCLVMTGIQGWFFSKIYTTPSLGILWLTTLLLFFNKPQTLVSIGIFYLVIIFTTLWVMAGLRETAPGLGELLYLAVFLMIFALLGFRLYYPLALFTGATVGIVHWMSTWHSTGFSHQSGAAQGIILTVSWGIGTIVGYWICYNDRIRFVTAQAFERVNQQLKDHEDSQESELIRMNKSLALEIRAHTEAETRLRESEEKYKNLVNSLPEGIFIVQGGSIVFFNPGLERLTGLSGEVLSNIAPEALFATGDTCPEPGDAGCHDYILGPKQVKKYIEKQWVDIQFNSAPARLYAVRDITERVMARQEKKRLEQELEKAKKMEALGLLAGGVAHDLNNVLSGIVSTPELLLMDLPRDSELRESVLTIKDSGKRAAIIVDELLTLARGSAKMLESVRLNGVIEDYLLSPEFSKAAGFHPDVIIEKALDPDLPLLNASGVHMHKIIMNLVGNAMEAVQTTGRVCINTVQVKFEKKILKGYEKPIEGPYILLSVEDTGPGISVADMDRIFEPFYTKKILGRSGTGLGLSIVWNIVHDHKGFIQVHSQKGSTRFDLYFPISPLLKETAKPDRIYCLSDYTGKNERVLVVDDVDTQQKITANMLRRLGYRVAVVGSGEEAIVHAKENRVDLVVLDMIMDPGINGLVTFRELQSIQPEIKAIIASGYSETQDVQEAQALGAGLFIKKPFSLQCLGLAVKGEFEREYYEKFHD